MDSILDTVKKSLGVDIDYKTFDTVIISKINTILLGLKTLGVGPIVGFVVTGNTQTWEEFLGNVSNIEDIETYICTEVRKVFDPLSIEQTGTNPNSILNDIKKPLGLELTDNAFDIDVIMNINFAFMSLNQLGVGPNSCFHITGINETWFDFLGDNSDFHSVKTYIYLKTKMVFDPPTTSAVLDSINNQLTELEWRLRTQAEKEVLNGL
jgi:hypothetical protein